MIPNALLSASQKNHRPQELRSYCKWEGVRIPLLMVPRQKGEEVPQVKNGTNPAVLAKPCCK
ncbi:MAG: hypothetical protein A4E32_00544 [Methanomassiliicoccales archaeon PtaU1.Bin124]|nr:MAG: hypothetical protein A4E32_00544 [Methanomassiliicoccales archaeon PtaU1.Bin124]